MNPPFFRRTQLSTIQDNYLLYSIRVQQWSCIVPIKTHPNFILNKNQTFFLPQLKKSYIIFIFSLPLGDKIESKSLQRSGFGFYSSSFSKLSTGEKCSFSPSLLILIFCVISCCSLFCFLFFCFFERMGSLDL